MLQNTIKYLSIRSLFVIYTFAVNKPETLQIETTPQTKILYIYIYNIPIPCLAPAILN